MGFDGLALALTSINIERQWTCIPFNVNYLLSPPPPLPQLCLLSAGSPGALLIQALFSGEELVPLSLSSYLVTDRDSEGPLSGDVLLPALSDSRQAFDYPTGLAGISRADT